MIVAEFLIKLGGHRFHQPVRDSYIYFQKYNADFEVWTTLSSSREKDQTPSLYFDSLWDNWLMTVVTRILEISSELDDMERYHIIIDQIPQIDHVYEAVVEFIKWYNKERE